MKKNRKRGIKKFYLATTLLSSLTNQQESQTLIDHIITNIPNEVVLTDVLKTDEISDHSTPYVIMNVKKEKFEPRYKFIRDVKNFKQNDFNQDFSQLPFNVTFAFDDPEDKLEMLNKLILSCFIVMHQSKKSK